MSWRKTGIFHAPQEVLVMTCDICERDIGHEDERRPKAHYQVSRVPNPGAIDDQDPPAVVCSPECLRAYAAKESEPDRAPPHDASTSRGKLRK